jgi:phosphoglycolate phosphatase
MDNTIKYDLLLFDLDGTLIDSRQDIADGVNRMLEELGLHPIDPKIIIAFIGRGVSPLIGRSIEYSRRRYGGVGELPGMDQGMELFIKHYGAGLLNHTRCYPTVLETLRKLGPLPMALVTNKPQLFTSPILKGLGLDRFFSVIVCGDTKKKPDPSLIFDCVEKFTASPQETLMVGDSHVDLEMGLRAGVRTCFANYGFGTADGYQPDHILNRFSDLMEIVPAK